MWPKHNTLLGRQTRTIACLGDCSKATSNWEQILERRFETSNSCESISGALLGLLDDLYGCRERYCGGNMRSGRDVNASTLREYCLRYHNTNLDSESPLAGSVCKQISNIVREVQNTALFNVSIKSTNTISSSLAAKSTTSVAELPFTSEAISQFPISSSIHGVSSQRSLQTWTSIPTADSPSTVSVNPTPLKPMTTAAAPTASTHPSRTRSTAQTSNITSPPGPGSTLSSSSTHSLPPTTRKLSSDAMVAIIMAIVCMSLAIIVLLLWARLRPKRARQWREAQHPAPGVVGKLPTHFFMGWETGVGAVFRVRQTEREMATTPTPSHSASQNRSVLTGTETITGTATTCSLSPVSEVEETNLAVLFGDGYRREVFVMEEGARALEKETVLDGQAKEICDLTTEYEMECRDGINQAMRPVHAHIVNERRAVTKEIGRR